jgi:hypothetical protein
VKLSNDNDGGTQADAPAIESPRSEPEPVELPSQEPEPQPEPEVTQADLEADTREWQEAHELRANRERWDDPTFVQHQRELIERKQAPIRAMMARFGKPYTPRTIDDGRPVTPADALASLTPEQRARWERMGSGRKALVVELLASRDKLMAEEALRRLSPAPPPPKPIETVPDAVEATAAGNPKAMMALTEMLCRRFDDRKSWHYFKQVSEQLFQNPGKPQLAADVLDAFRQASGPKARNGGAVFVTVLQRQHGWA